LSSSITARPTDTPNRRSLDAQLDYARAITVRAAPSAVTTTIAPVHSAVRSTGLLAPKRKTAISCPIRQMVSNNIPAPVLTQRRHYATLFDFRECAVMRQGTLNHADLWGNFSARPLFCPGMARMAPLALLFVIGMIVTLAVTALPALVNSRTIIIATRLSDKGTRLRR
jgi:hypothetical protein